MKEENIKINEDELFGLIRNYQSDEMLLYIHNLMKPYPSNLCLINKEPPEFSNFVMAGLAGMVFRFSNPFRGKVISSLQEFRYIYTKVLDYLTYDPITHNIEIRDIYNSSHYYCGFLRIFGSQIPFNVESYGLYTRSWILYNKILPTVASRPEMQNFSFNNEFHKLYKISLLDFITIGYLSYFASKGNTLGLTIGYFEKARKDGMLHLDNSTISQALKKLSSDPEQFRKTYEKMMQRDRRFSMYDFNPLFIYPLLRPWKDGYRKNHMIAPLPDFILYRISDGIFYEMFGEYKTDFSNWFGYLFEAYVGEILKNSIPSEDIWSENDIRESNPEYSGKISDWVIRDGAKLILVECKATRFSRTAIETGNPNAVESSLKQVKKGLIQLHEFRNAIISKVKDLKTFNSNYQIIIPLLISFDNLFCLNSIAGHDYINELLKQNNINEFNWHVMSLQEIEVLQPYIKAGFRISEIFNMLSQNNYNFNKVLVTMTNKTGLSFKDSFMYPYFEEIIKELKIHD